MAETPREEKDVIKDLLDRLSAKGRKGREAAIEALAISTEDDDWMPDELIDQGGIRIVTSLLREKNPHIIYSALTVIIAIASTGETEPLIEGGVIACLDSLQDDKNRIIRQKVHEALALLQPDVGEAVVTKPQDEY